MVPIEPEPPTEPPAESGELGVLALRTVLLPGEQTPDHGRQADRDRQRNQQNETRARSASATDRRHLGFRVTWAAPFGPPYEPEHREAGRVNPQPALTKLTVPP